MSLLEDVFLEDETTEAQDLERIIEGGEDEELGYESDEGRGEDEAEEDKRRVDPSKPKATKTVKNPRFILNPARLTGPRGIQVIPEHFKDFKFKGKGHEKEDLDLVLKKLEHWAYRLYPKFKFEDCLKKIETLGKKRPVMVHLHKIRSDQLSTEEAVVQKDSSDEEIEPQDEFDILLQQQIDLVRATPGPNSAKKSFDTTIGSTPGPHSARKGFETPLATPIGNHLNMPKATSSPSINEEQKERMLRNKKLAEERRLAKLNMAKKNPIDNSVNIDNSVRENVDNESNDQENKTDNGITNTNNKEVSKDNSETVNYSDSESDSNEELTKENKKKTNVLNSSDEDISDNDVYEKSDKITAHTNADENFDKLIESEVNKEITENINKDTKMETDTETLTNQEAELTTNSNIETQENVPNDIIEDIMTASEQDNINNLAVTENQLNLNNEDSMVMEQDFDDEF